jgi:hypothetical protein
LRFKLRCFLWLWFELRWGLIGFPGPGKRGGRKIVGEADDRWRRDREGDEHGPKCSAASATSSWRTDEAADG